jgi:uroporphyrin-III C-methyltransferase
LAAASSTKQPLTKRGVARSVAFFTSSTAPGHPEQATLPDCDTLVQYMGGREAIETAQRLLKLGHSPDLPVIAIENCSRPNERIMRIQLKDLEKGLPDCQGPVLVLIGEAMAPRRY